MLRCPVLPVRAKPMRRIVILLTLMLCSPPLSRAEELPLFIAADHGDGDGRETKARRPVWFSTGDG